MAKAIRITDSTEEALREITRGQTKPPVVIVGGPGTGKTRHADALAQHYGCRFILDGWSRGQPMAPGCLVLTNDRVPGAIPIAQALRAAGLEA